MHKYTILMPTDMDSLMNLIMGSVKTFGNEAVHIDDSHALVVRTAMNSGRFL